MTSKMKKKRYGIRQLTISSEKLSIDSTVKPFKRRFLNQVYNVNIPVSSNPKISLI